MFEVVWVDVCEILLGKCVCVRYFGYVCVCEVLLRVDEVIEADELHEVCGFRCNSRSSRRTESSNWTVARPCAVRIYSHCIEVSAL